MKKILSVLVVLACVFTISSSAFATGRQTAIPFWQNGGNVTTLISIVAGNGTATGFDTGLYASTGATITVTLTSTDTGGSYTILPTASTAAMTSGATFATAKFLSYAGRSLQVDTSQIGTTAATAIWTTGDAYSSTAVRFGHGTVEGSVRNGDHRGWVAVYGGTNPAGFTVDLSTF